MSNERAARYRELMDTYKDDKESDAGFLLDILSEYEDAISWNTSCLNCSKLLDSNYTMFSILEEIQGLTDWLKGENRGE